MSAEELLRKLDAERDAYLATFQQVHEALSRAIIADATSTPAQTFQVSSPTKPVSDRVSRLSISDSVRKASTLGPSTFKSSIGTGDDDESDDDEALYVQDLLPSTSFDDEHLRSHLKSYDWNESSLKILSPVISEDGKLSSPHLWPESLHYPHGHDDRSNDSLYQVFDVGADGAPLPLHTDNALKMLKGQTMWHHMKDINVDSTKQRQAVGRITVLREPSPHLFGAIHFTMLELFDMDEIFETLVEQGTTTANMTRAYSEDPRKQRSFVFNLEYFTIIGDDCQPKDWQMSDEERERPADHIPISRCSSIVALSLVGPPFRKLRNTSRRAKTHHGFVHSPWSPWHVLNIQCFPDWKSSTDSHDSTKHYVNGPEAFLNTLLVEYKDAQKRFEEISHRVTKLITPPANFMFNGDLRDKLLFEDDNFTYSRRYFWAFQTLGTMNQSIKAMIDAYEDTFTEAVWDGRHKTLWPLVDDKSSRNVYWRKRMASLRKEFEVEIKALEIIMDENNDRRKEIRNLRDNLFSGTSVLESRKSVEQTEITVQQGHNIKLLTLVNMFFLPLTFVTSVFGMTNMPTEESFWRFGLVMATVCIPFFLLIGSMNTNVGMRFWKEQFGNFLARTARIFTWSKKKDSEEATNGSDKEIPVVRKPHRSASASEARAQRMEPIEQREKEQDVDPSPSPRKSISFGQPFPRRPHNSVSSSIMMQNEAVLSSTAEISTLASPPPLPAPQPALVAAPSYAKSNTLSESTVFSNPSTVNAALQKNGLGIWDKLRASRRRNGARDYHV